MAESFGIGFSEVSVIDNSPQLYKAFERLLYEARARPVTKRKFSVSKMLGKDLTQKRNHFEWWHLYKLIPQNAFPNQCIKAPLANVEGKMERDRGNVPLTTPPKN